MLDTRIPVPSEGRTYSTRRRIRLSDMDAKGRLRLDAVARFLQDIAIDDVQETGWGIPEHLWFVRSIRVDVVQPFAGDTEVELTTWCSGVAAIAAGRRWSVRATAAGASRSTACGSTSTPSSGRRGSRTSASTPTRRAGGTSRPSSELPDPPADARAAVAAARG